MAQSIKDNRRSEGAEEVANEFKQELQLDPTNANAAYELGELNRRFERYEEAKELFTKVVNYDPMFEEAEIGLGRTLMALSKPDQALPHLRRAIALNSENEVSFYQLSQAHRQLGNTVEQKKALAEFTRLRNTRETRKVQTVPPSPVTKQQIEPSPGP